MRTNRPTPAAPIAFTHEGARTTALTAIKELRRSCCAALLFEDMFYEKGSTHAQRVTELVRQCDPRQVAALAVECRDRMYLRHMPLFLVRELARIPGNGTLVADTLALVIQRPDELCEYLALYWKNTPTTVACPNCQGVGTTRLSWRTEICAACKGSRVLPSRLSSKKEPISAGSKRGLARAFHKFDADTLAKYDRDNAVKLRDVLRLVHAKPLDREQSATFKKVIDRTLEAPDTWEVALSGGADKKTTFERLLRERKLGGLAFLRNLRNMIQAGVDSDLILERFEGGFGKVLPFRFVAALAYAPQYVRQMDLAMQRCLEGLERLPGRTGILVDVSGSMDTNLSEKSQMNRIDAAGGLAVLVSAIAQFPRVWTFSTRVVEVPAYAGLALIQSIQKSQPHSSTRMGAAVTELNKERLDRLIVITDEQSEDRVPAPACKGYIINVSNYKNGVGNTNGWTKIDGWSERVIDYIQAVEVND